MTTRPTPSPDEKPAASPSDLIDARIAELGDWRGEVLARVRRLIREADPDMVEEVKWRKPSNAMRTPSLPGLTRQSSLLN